MIYKITKILTIIFSILLFFSCSKKNDKKNKFSTEPQNIKVEKPITIEALYKDFPYPSDTILSNGYHLVFRYFQRNKNSNIEQTLILKKEKKLIDTLNTLGYAAPHKNLGYLGADFKDYFALINSFGSGNPHELTLIRKTDAKIIKKGYFVDNFKNPDLLLYANENLDSLKIYNIRKNKDFGIEKIEKIKLDDFTYYQISDRIKIEKIENGIIFISYLLNDKNEKLIKKYNL